MVKPPPFAGWYQDPETPGLERYWDGKQWTYGTRATITAGARFGASGAWQRWRGLRTRTKALAIGAVAILLIALVPHNGDASTDQPDKRSAADSAPERTAEVPAPTRSRPERTTVPGVRAMSLAQARSRLNKADLHYRVVKQYSWKPVGQVLSQRIAAGSKVQPGRVITLVVAMAMPTIPHVAGKGAEAGAAVLHQAGFKVSVVREVVTSSAGGVVLRTTPAAGTRKAPGSIVTLVVSNLVRPVAPAPPPPSNCTPGYKPCLPPAYDYDCAGGSGDGPGYANGPIYVSGSDPYGLDADGDGVACEY